MSVTIKLSPHLTERIVRIEVCSTTGRTKIKDVSLGYGQLSLTDSLIKVLDTAKLKLRDINKVVISRSGPYFTIVRQVTTVANALAWLQGATLYEASEASPGSPKKIEGFLKPTYSHGPNITRPKLRK